MAKQQADAKPGKPSKIKMLGRSVPAVQSLERAAAILGVFSANRPSLSVTEIAPKVGLSKSTVRRLLLTLEQLGFVQSDARGVYGLGITCLRLGFVAQVSMDVRKKARPILEELVTEVGETAYLFIPRGGEAVCLDVVDAPHSLRVLYTGVGTVFPLHVGAAARALLSAQSETELARILRKPLKRYTPSTITMPTKLREDIARTRRQGYVLSVDDLVQGAAGIGCVVVDHRGEVVCSISIGGLKERFLSKEFDALRTAVVNAAAKISARMGAVQNALAN
jgi:DNA-binding IclR family transcriptional regulator